MSNKTGQKAQKKSENKEEVKNPVGVSISHEQWGKIIGELSVFKQPVVDAVVKAVNQNSSPVFE